MQRRLIGIAGGAVAALEFGAGKLAVIFLHANGFNAMTYAQVLAPLADDMRVLALDMRGHGRSTLPWHAEGHGWLIYAEDLLAVIAALGEAPPVVAGHSMGGTTALLAAAGLAAGTRLVLFDPVVAPPAVYGTAGPDWQQPLAVGALRRNSVFANAAEAFGSYRGRGAFRTWPDAMLHDYLADGLVARPEGGVALACDPAWEAANFACWGIDNPTAGLRRNGVRVLRAAAGSTCFGEEAQQMATVPGTTHFLPMERPDIVREAVREAVKEARDG